MVTDYNWCNSRNYNKEITNFVGLEMVAIGYLGRWSKTMH